MAGGEESVQVPRTGCGAGQDEFLASLRPLDCPLGVEDEAAGDLPGRGADAGGDHRTVSSRLLEVGLIEARPLDPAQVVGGHPGDGG